MCALTTGQHRLLRWLSLKTNSPQLISISWGVCTLRFIQNGTDDALLLPIHIGSYRAENLTLKVFSSATHELCLQTKSQLPVAVHHANPAEQ